MEKTKNNNLEETITRYALILFAILLALIVYTYFTTQDNKPQEVAAEPDTAKQSKTPTSKVAFQTLPPKTELTKKTEIQENTKTMKPDDYKIPAKKQLKKQKLTELLPQDLKENIENSLLTREQLKELSPAEREEYKKTQQKLAHVLREIGQTEAENQKLETSLSEVKNQSKQLDTEVKKLRNIK